MRRHNTQAWLINTGLTGGPYGVGHRIKLAHTRAIIDAIHDGTLAEMPTVVDERFGFAIPTRCPGVPEEILQPRNTWSDPSAYDEMADRLARLFAQNFEKYRAGCSREVAEAGPRVVNV
nr:phosphoenolpyruvate carboxykinase (ATP) [Rhodothermus marinus]